MYLANFNSIKVQLEHLAVFLFLYTDVYFNSIKVQLEQEQPCRFRRWNAFQFHKGTIRTDHPRTVEQFRKISIP